MELGKKMKVHVQTFLFRHNAEILHSCAISLSVNQPRSGMTAFDPLQRCSSYNQPTNREIITVKHKAYLLRVSVPLCVSIGVTKRQRKGRANGRWGHEAPNIHLSPVKMRIVQSTQRTHIMHPSLFCFSALAAAQTWIASHFISPSVSRIET